MRAALAPRSCVPMREAERTSMRAPSARGRIRTVTSSGSLRRKVRSIASSRPEADAAAGLHRLDDLPAAVGGGLADELEGLLGGRRRG